MAEKALVAYFSATGTTAKVAQRLAEVTGADLFEIKPKVPYEEADLNWHDEQSRSTIEMKDEKARPAIAAMPDLDKYDVVYIGFPIWWYVAPRIIQTFLESGDFADKNIAIFATSGSSGMGDTERILVDCAPDAWWLGAERFEADVSKAELKEWVEDMAL